MSAAAAAAAALAQQQEEELMTPYTPKDLAENWEFKILRSVAGQFRNPLLLRAMLDEEAKAGWTLVEKFDNSRIRLKRPASAQAGDAMLNFDARRTYVGIRPAALALLSTAGGFAAAGLILAIAMAAHH